MSSNQFSGVLPSQITIKMPKLAIFIVKDNKLQGDLNLVFATDRVSCMTLFDGSKNKFSGSLPSALFNLPNISTVVLISNCFDGSLPADICTSVSLQTLALDGLSSNCGDSTWENAVSQRGVYGSIPSCVWQSKSLQSLHLSANGFTGKLNDLVGGSNLTDLILSNNHLTGTIPNSFKIQKFSSLDFSNNKFKGTCDDFDALDLAGREVKLSLNRLSGDVPSSFYDISDIDILEGNLFGCSAKLSDDANSNSVSCGSKNLNQSLFFGCFVVGILMCILISGLFCIKFLKSLKLYQFYFNLIIDTQIENI